MSQPATESPSWWTFRGLGAKADRSKVLLPEPPPWRRLGQEARARRAHVYRPGDRERTMVNAALALRRPLLVTGPPGSGKSSLAFAVAEELGLGEVLHWPITTRTTLADGLYNYDAIARLHAASLNRPSLEQGDDTRDEAEDIGRFIRLGPLGTALLATDPQRPRVLLIDEIDKSDIDLPNDLLHFFEEGQFEIPELRRQQAGSGRPIEVQLHGSDERASVDGQVRATVFPFVVMTSNQERDFPPAFLRRCLRLDIEPPGEAELAEIVRRHFEESVGQLEMEPLVDIILDFVRRRGENGASLATDQLLNLIHLLLGGAGVNDKGGEADLREAILRPLGE